MGYKVGDRFANRAEPWKTRTIREIGTDYVKVEISELGQIKTIDHEYVQDSIKCGRWIKN